MKKPILSIINCPEALLITLDYWTGKTTRACNWFVNRSNTYYSKLDDICSDRNMLLSLNFSGGNPRSYNFNEL